jgi:hypothetical protein
MPTTNGCRQGGMGDEPRVPPGWWREHEGEETPSQPESSGGHDEEEDEDEEEGEVTPLPTLYPQRHSITRQPPQPASRGLY